MFIYVFWTLDWIFIIIVGISDIRYELFDIFFQIGDVGAIGYFMNDLALQCEQNLRLRSSFKFIIAQFLNFLLINQHNINSFLKLINDLCL